MQGLKRISLFSGAQSNRTTDQSDATEDNIFEGQSHSIGVYKGNVVYIKRIYKRSLDLTRNIRQELIQMREMRHENINSFIGACIDSPNIAIVSVYCARGSLEVFGFSSYSDLSITNYSCRMSFKTAIFIWTPCLWPRWSRTWSR